MAKDIEKNGGIGVRQRQRIMKELIAAGYLEVHQTKQGKVYQLIETKGNPQGQNSMMTKPIGPKPIGAKQRHIQKKESTKERNKKIKKDNINPGKLTTAGVQIFDPEEYREFMLAFPKSAYASGKDGREAFYAARKIVDHETLISAASAFSAQIEREGTDPKFVPRIENWLAKERWTEHQPAEKVWANISDDPKRPRLVKMDEDLLIECGYYKWSGEIKQEWVEVR